MASPGKVIAGASVVVGLAAMAYILVHNFRTAKTTSTTPIATPAVIHVTIENDAANVGKYVPAAIHVRGNRNEVIEFTNRSKAVHTATENHGRFTTGKIPEGGTVRIRITVPGLFTYHCALHPGMRGTINVLLKRQPRRTG